MAHESFRENRTDAAYLFCIGCARVNVREHLKGYTMRLLPILFTILLASGISQPANSLEKSSRWLNEVSQEFALCYGYYSLVAICLDPNRDADIAQSYRAFADTFLTVMYRAGKSAGLSDAALQARASLSFSQMQNDTERDCRNIAVILQKYSEKCKRMASDPEGSMRSIMERFK